MDKMQLLLTREQIAERVADLGTKIARDYTGRRPLLVGALKGAFIFLADLARRVTPSPEIDFIQLSSYGSQAFSAGEVKVLLEPMAEIVGRDVIVVDDIVDTGLCLQFLREYFLARGAASLATCALLMRRSQFEAGESVDYLGFVIDEGFVVGYGLDCREEHRTLPDIYVLEDEP